MTADRVAARPPQGLVLASLGLCILASALLLFAPVGLASLSGSAGTTTGDDSGIGESSREETGPVVELRPASVAFFAAPVAVAAAPLLALRRRAAVAVRTTSAALLLLWVLFLAFGGGIFYLPSVVLMAIAAATAGSDASGPATESPSG